MTEPTDTLIYLNILLGLYLAIGLIPTISIYKAGQYNRLESMLWGSFMIFYAAALSVIYSQTSTLLDSYGAKLLSNCDLYFLNKTCSDPESERLIHLYTHYKSAILMWSALTVGFVGGPGINFFSKGISEVGDMLSPEDKERWLKNTLFVRRVGRANTIAMLSPVILLIGMILLFIFMGAVI